MLRTTALARTAPDTRPKPAKGPRTVKCGAKGCMHRMLPNPKAPWCSEDCSVVVALAAGAERRAKLAKADRAVKKADRAATKARLIELEPAKYWRKKAKTAMHAYVRAVAEGKPCCSCDTILHKLGRMGGDFDAGHFRPVSLAKHLEFDPRNIWGQCKSCNGTLKRGNVQEYERRLRIKMGDAFVDDLLADNAPRHLKIHDFRAIEAEYKAKLKAMKGQS